jgi:hypothetical protein
MRIPQEVCIYFFLITDPTTPNQIARGISSASTLPHRSSTALPTTTTTQQTQPSHTAPLIMADFNTLEIVEREHRPLVFLTLTPLTSDAYPAPLKRPSSATSPSSPSTGAARRRSSVTSNSSQDAQKRFRFLKLGPVSNGSHMDEHKEDYHEVDADE